MSKVYLQAARVVEGIRSRKFGLQGANIRGAAQFALVKETLRWWEVTDHLVQETGLLQQGRAHSSAKQQSEWRALMNVMVYELVVGPKKKLSGGGRVARTVKQVHPRLLALLARLKIEKGALDDVDLLGEERRRLPVYCRVNTLLASRPQVVQRLQEEYRVTSLSEDAHLSDVVRVDAEEKAKLRPLCDEGVLLLQQWSSCVPAHVLAPPEDAVCLDACSAPGNKTTQLAAMVPRGRVVAVEKNRQRFQTLEETVARAHAQSLVECVCADFLQLPVSLEVTYILLDPSCSGSGLVERYGDADESAERLQALAAFQKRALLHAMSYPNVKRVVYSTCSVHETENEEVVREALAQQNEFHLIEAMPQWTTRGHAPYEKCLRVDPDTDGSIGFFVALFERRTKRSKKK